MHNSTLDSYKVDRTFALYSTGMESTGDLRVSDRGQMSLPASARHRWKLDKGGRVSFLDLGDAVVIIPGGVDALRDALLSSVDDAIWQEASAGFGDADLASE